MENSDEADVPHEVDNQQGDRGRVCAAGGTGRGQRPEHERMGAGSPGGTQEQSAAKSHEDILLGELLGLRAILLNLLFKVAKGEAMTEEQMQSLIAAADAGKMERARKLLAPACAAGVES